MGYTYDLTDAMAKSNGLTAEKVIWVPTLVNPKVNKVIFNPPATIVLWDDNTKTVVRCHEDDTYNPEYGFMMCCAKKLFGNTARYRDVIQKWCWDNDKCSVEYCAYKAYMKSVENIPPHNLRGIEDNLKTLSTKRLEHLLKNPYFNKDFKNVIYKTLCDKRREMRACI